MNTLNRELPQFADASFGKTEGNPKGHITVDQLGGVAFRPKILNHANLLSIR